MYETEQRRCSNQDVSSEHMNSMSTNRIKLRGSDLNMSPDVRASKAKLMPIFSAVQGIENGIRNQPTLYTQNTAAVTSQAEVLQTGQDEAISVGFSNLTLGCMSPNTQRVETLKEAKY